MKCHRSIRPSAPATLHLGDRCSARGSTTPFAIAQYPFLFAFHLDQTIETFGILTTR